MGRVERTSLDNPALFLNLYRENPRGLPETWGAVPMLTSCDIQEQQNLVHQQQSELFSPEHVPSYVSRELAGYIEMVNMSRVEHRESKNRDSFSYRGVLKMDVPLDHLDVFAAAQDGTASPAELLYVRSVLRMPSVELASLTHPYGQRIGHLDEMRSAVNQAVLMHGGRLAHELPRPAEKYARLRFDRALVEYEVKGADQLNDPQKMEGIHMTRKRKIGVLPDQTEIYERSSFIVRLDALPEHYRTAIREIPFEGNRNWAQQVRRAENFYEYVADLLKNDDFAAAIPLSTTVVAKHDNDTALFLSEAARLKRMQELRAMSNTSLI